MAILPSKLKKGKSFGSRYQGQRLNATNPSLATGATQDYDVDISDFDNVTVLASLAGAAAGDLTLSVFPFDSAGVVHLQPLAPSVTPQAQLVSAGAVLAAVQFDLRGLDTIRIRVKNNNAGAQTLNFVDIFAGVTGAEIN